MPAPTAPDEQTLEHRRLTFRIRRLERVVEALEERVHVHDGGGVVPPPLRLAVRDFRAELADVRGRLVHLMA